MCLLLLQAMAVHIHAGRSRRRGTVAANVHSSQRSVTSVSEQLLLPVGPRLSYSRYVLIIAIRDPNPKIEWYSRVPVTNIRVCVCV